MTYTHACMQYINEYVCVFFYEGVCVREREVYLSVSILL